MQNISSITEKKFLQFFFSRIQVNETDSYPEFPFLSLCGRERNYIRCDDLPLVFTHQVGCLPLSIYFDVCFFQVHAMGLLQNLYMLCMLSPLLQTTKETPDGTKEEHLAYGNAGDTMTLPFQPSELCMQVETGRVYHPAMDRMGGVGLVRSKLAIQLSTYFIFGDGDEQPPTHIHWGGKEVKLSQSVVPILESLEHIRRYSLGLEDGAEG